MDEPEAITLARPDKRPRHARVGDSQTDRELWHVVHDHDAEFVALKREFSEFKREFFDMKLLLATLSKSTDDLAAKFDARLREEFLAHEKREMSMQIAQAEKHFKGLAWVLVITLGVIGTLATFILSKVVLAAGGAG